MKITTKDHANYTHLFHIDSGELFRPANSQQVYMKIWNELNDNCWNECESCLYDYYENPQDHDFDDIRNEARVCVDMTTGEIMFFHRDLQVVKVNYKFTIEGD